MTSPTDSLPPLRTIGIQPLAAGVWAAIAVPGEGALCNAAIVDLGERTLVFDTLRTPAAAEELRLAARHLTGRAPAWVVNSHWHDDHVAGNQVFAPDAIIIATEQTRQLMATRVAPEYAQDAQELPDFLRALETQLAAETDQRARAQLALRIAENRQYAAALPAIQITLPDQTFDQRLTLHGSQRVVDLLTYGGGHTASDVLLHLPAEEILFAGDLGFLDCQPWLPDGDPREWARILDTVQRLPLRSVVPGHGPVSDLRCLSLTRDYLTDLERLARATTAAGGTADQAAALPVPAPFASWGFPQFFATNMRFLMQWLASQPDTHASLHSLQ